MKLVKAKEWIILRKKRKDNREEKLKTLKQNLASFRALKREMVEDKKINYLNHLSK